MIGAREEKGNPVSGDDFGFEVFFFFFCITVGVWMALRGKAIECGRQIGATTQEQRAPCQSSADHLSLVYLFQANSVFGVS